MLTTIFLITGLVLFFVGKTFDDIPARLLVEFKFKEFQVLGSLQQFAECLKTVICLAKTRVAAFDSLLYHRPPYLLFFSTFFKQGLHGPHNQIQPFLTPFILRFGHGTWGSL